MGTELSTNLSAMPERHSGQIVLVQLMLAQIVLVFV